MDTSAAATMAHATGMMRWWRQRKHTLGTLVLLACLIAPLTAQAQSELAIVYEAAKAAYQAYQFFDGLNGDETHDAIMAAINHAVHDIRTALDAFEAAENLACSDAITIDFANFLAYTLDNQQAFARDYLPCLTEAVNYMNVPGTALAHVDQVGRGFNIVGSVLLFVYDYLSFDNQGLLNLIHEGNETILARLRPPCTLHVLEPDTPERRVTCTAYNGDVASDHLLITSPSFAQDKEALQDEAAQNTSYRIAKAMLEGHWLVPQSQSLLAGLFAAVGEFRATLPTTLDAELQLASPASRTQWCKVISCE
jgi:hypothetical protein